MAGLFNDVSEFFTGAKTNAAEEQQRQLAAEANQRQRELFPIATGANKDVLKQGQQAYDYGTQGVQSSYGKNAADYLQRANQAANAQASQDAVLASGQAAQQGLRAARGAGLNKGQAALMANQNVGQNYTNTYLQGKGQQLGQYGQGANAFQQQQGMGAGMRQNAAAQLGNLASGQQSQATSGYNQLQGQAQQQAATGGVLVGNAIQAGAQAAMSDERQKTNITTIISKLKGEKQQSPLDAVIAKLRPVTYNYKSTSGEDPTKDRVGILAQDLEKTPMKDNVSTDENGNKVVDINQQTLSNTGLIAEMAQRMKTLEDHILGKGGK